MNARAIRAIHRGTVSAEFTRDDVPGMGDKEVTFTALSCSIAWDDVRRRAYADGYSIEDVKIDGVDACLDESIVIENRIRSDKRLDETINEKLDELANGFNT